MMLLSSFSQLEAVLIPLCIYSSMLLVWLLHADALHKGVEYVSLPPSIGELGIERRVKGYSGAWNRLQLSIRRNYFFLKSLASRQRSCIFLIDCYSLCYIYF